MKILLLTFVILSLLSNDLFAMTIIKCNEEKGPEFDLYPKIYISKDNELCFIVTGWRSYKGQNCVIGGGSASWSAVALLLVNGKSLGRHNTLYRVRDVTLSDDTIKYLIEWRRSANWKPMQHIQIDRLTGLGFVYHMDIHDGTPISCKGISTKCDPTSCKGST